MNIWLSSISILFTLIVSSIISAILFLAKKKQLQILDGQRRQKVIFLLEKAQKMSASHIGEKLSG